MDILEVAKKINNNGGKLYLVGGALRDEILKKEIHDEDYVVTGISFSKFLTLFPQAIIQGKDFPVFVIDNREFAIARKERKIGIGHKEFDIESNEKITIEEDLFRRDITINAIAKDVLTGEIIDTLNGIEDIKKKRIRAVSNHFKEDPLRAYRVVRFASTLSFTVDPNTILLMNNLKDELSSLSAERVYNEFQRALLSDRPSIFFNVLKEANILDVHFKEIYDLIGVEQPIIHHPEGDAYNHTMIVLDRVADKTKDYIDARKLEIRYGALVHDLGKGLTPKEEYPHHIDHEEKGVEPVQNLSNRLKVPKRLKKAGITATLEHMRAGIFNTMTPSKKVGFIERVSKSILGLDGIEIIANADNMENDNIVEFQEIGKELMSKIDGNYVIKQYNIKSGKAVADKLHELRVSMLKRMNK